MEVAEQTTSAQHGADFPKGWDTHLELPSLNSYCVSLGIVFPSVASRTQQGKRDDPHLLASGTETHGGPGPCAQKNGGGGAGSVLEGATSAGLMAWPGEVWKKFMRMLKGDPAGMNVRMPGLTRRP